MPSTSADLLIDVLENAAAWDTDAIGLFEAIIKGSGGVPKMKAVLLDILVLVNDVAGIVATADPATAPLIKALQAAAGQLKTVL